MKTYGSGFAQFYNLKCGGFANTVAPRIVEFYQKTDIGKTNKAVLDLCCGTGQLALYLLQNGFHVTGIDLSSSMLEYAKNNTQSFIASGQATFIQDDATSFHLDERFGLVISTYDALNHLDDEAALKSCFQHVYDVSDGYFIFDLHTLRGLMRWNSIQVDESETSVVITHKSFNRSMDKAYAKFSCFLQQESGVYQRIDELISNTPFMMESVKTMLLDVGWNDVYFARLSDLGQPIPDPEAEGKVFVIAQK